MKRTVRIGVSARESHALCPELPRRRDAKAPSAIPPPLPDEIISEVLSPALKVSEEKFLDNKSEVSPFASPSVSSSAALVVCKAWLCVATPFLYHVVVIRSTAQPRALQRTLDSNPDLGKFIKMLRVEGGFGPEMGDVLEHTLNVTDIFLSLQIHGTDPTTGLVLGLPHISPTRLIIFDYASRRSGKLKTKHVRDVIQAVKDCVPSWMNITAVNFLYYDPVSGGEQEDLVTAICGHATVEKVSFPSLKRRDMPFLTAIGARPTLEAVYIHDEGTPSVISMLAANPRLSSLVHLAGNREIISKKTGHTPSPRGKSIFPAIGVGPSGWLAISEPEAAEPKWILRHKHVRYLFVSKIFHRLALPSLFRALEFPKEHSLRAFCNRLTLTPTLGIHVHEMKLPLGYSYFSGHHEVEMSRILTHTPHLRRLLGDNGWMSMLSWDALVTLAQTAGSKVEEISGIEFKPPTPGVSSYSPRVFERFTSLKAFTWSCGNGQIPFFTETEPVSRTALPALESLRLASSVSLLVFMAMDMSVLGCEVQEQGGDHFAMAALASEFQHTALKTLIINKRPLSIKFDNEKAWMQFFDSLDLNHLPSLREIRVSAFEDWPTTEHAISKSISEFEPWEDPWRWQRKTPWYAPAILRIVRNMQREPVRSGGGSYSSDPFRLENTQPWRKPTLKLPRTWVPRSFGGNFLIGIRTVAGARSIRVWVMRSLAADFFEPQVMIGIVITLQRPIYLSSVHVQCLRGSSTTWYTAGLLTVQCPLLAAEPNIFILDGQDILYLK
ncbi:hypothetical protein B0H16DRAFT_1781063 [Mycena metata]|uniref:Uncharacterized protein n=1 Tax=Mycena metata TaxID=1033252 RepID=A0AAD7NNS9_9AGAR|nr:hypothetical protein B0H16DRAFT_1781063 [Mycena metata]